MPRPKLYFTEEEKKEKNREYQARYAFKNPEKKREHQREYYEKNRESLLQKNKERRERKKAQAQRVQEPESRNDEELARRLTRKLNTKFGIQGIIKPSSRKNKRFVHLSGREAVHFGDPRAITFVDGANESKRMAYQLRASRIVNKNNELTYNKPGTANFLAYHLLW